MPSPKLLPAAFCILCALAGYGQGLKEYNHLLHVADSAYDAKDFKRCAEHYEKSMQLPASQRPATQSVLYYNAACVFSLIRQNQKAFHYLSKSLSAYQSNKNQRHVKLQHIASDKDLDNIRNDAAFEPLLRHYFPEKIIDFILAKEVSYSMVLDYLKTVGNDPEWEYAVSDKIIYWKKSGAKYIYNDKTRSLDLPFAASLRELGFTNCTFRLHLAWMDFDGVSQQAPYEHIAFDDCKFDGRVNIYQLNLINAPQFRKCSFREDFLLAISCKDNDYGGMQLDSCTIKYVHIAISAQNALRLLIKDNKCDTTSLFRVGANNVDNAAFLRNRMPKSDIVLGLKTSVLKFGDNTFNNIIIQNTVVGSDFDLQITKLNGKLTRT
jgi:hypothetical protein